MEPTFPLLRLPENAILRQLFEFSLISSKTKKLVTSSGFRADCVEISISGTICLTVYNGRDIIFHFKICNDTNDQNGELPGDTLPVAAFFGNRGTRVQLATPLLNFSKWLDHIRTVFCCTLPICIRFFRGSERFDFELLKETIGNADWLYVVEQSTGIHYKNILNHFNTPSRLFLDRNPFEEVSEIQKFFIQNYKSIRFHDVYSLEDMLLVNSERVEFSRSVSQKRFNQFVKHLIRGSNPRLQRMSLSIDITNPVSRDVLLKGIRCMEMSEDAKRKICGNQILSNVDMVQIKRKDGTPAVIATYGKYRLLNIHLVISY